MVRMKIGLHLYAFNIFPKINCSSRFRTLDRSAIRSLALWHTKVGTVFRAFIPLDLCLKCAATFDLDVD